MNHREISRAQYNAADPPSCAEINTGSLQRIADATEKMASSYDSLRNDRDMYCRWYKEGREAIAKLERRNAALKGVITKLKGGKA